MLTLRKRNSKLEFASMTCTREQVCDILESREYLPELFSLYYKIIQNKVAVEGKDPGRFEYIDPTAFMRYKGYVQRGEDEARFMEMMVPHRGNREPEIIFVPIKQVHHWHLLIMNFNGKAFTHYSHRKTTKRHQTEVNHVYLIFADRVDASLPFLLIRGLKPSIIEPLS